MTESVSLTLKHRLRIGGHYTRLVGVYAGTTIPVAVHIYRDRPAASVYSFERATDDVILHVSKEDFYELSRCQIPTPPGETHQICVEVEKKVPRGKVLSYGSGAVKMRFPP